MHSETPSTRQPAGRRLGRWLPVAPSRTRRWTVALIVLAALLIAGVLAAALLAGDPKEEAAEGRSKGGRENGALSLRRRSSRL